MAKENQIRKIVASVLGVAASSITGETARNKTPEWDSFNHLLLVSEIEKQTGARFTMKQVEQAKTVADLEKFAAQGKD